MVISTPCQRWKFRPQQQLKCLYTDVYPSGLTTVSGDQAQRVIDTVANFQQTVDDRKAEMDKLTGNN